MSNSTITDAVGSADTPSKVRHDRVRPLRLWPPVAILVAYGLFYVGLSLLDVSMFERFISRWIAQGVLLLAFLGWWLSRRQLAWRDRLGWLTIAIATFAAAGALSDPTLTYFMLAFSGLPYLIGLWVGWLVISRRMSVQVRRLGWCLACCVLWGAFTLVRWQGIDGNQGAQFAWRWSPTAEQLFLAEHRNLASAAAPGRAAEQQSIKPVVLQAGDWPQFRGPARDGKLVASEIRSDWSQHPPVRVWQGRVGPGWSSMAIVDGRLFTQEQRGELECVVCYEAATGREIWSHADQARFTEPLAGAGPRATPTFDGGRLYTLGAGGRLCCLDAARGKLVWAREVVDDTGAKLPQWGFSGSPLVSDGNVLVFAGGEKDGGLVAYRVQDGEPAWRLATGQQSYSSPQMIMLDDTRQTLILSDGGLLALDASSGKTLWNQPAGDGAFLPVIQPQTVGPKSLLVQTPLGTSLVEVSQAGGVWKIAEQWNTRNLKPSFNDFVVADGYIYGFDEGIFGCVELSSGGRKWKRGRYGHGQVLLVADQGLLVVLSEAGEVALVRATPEKLDELARFKAIEGKTWNHPVIAHGRLYVRNDAEMACYDVSREAAVRVAATVEDRR